jgi:uncharacterized lipoprotein YbaY/heat shock protein HslJ
VNNRLVPALLAVILSLVPSISAQSANPQITGSIAYRERMALPSDAVIDIQLQDVSIADIAAQVVAQTLLNAEGRQVPIPFTLSYDPAQIDPSHRYSVRATIRSGDGMLMFTTSQSYPVLTRGAPSKVNLLLRTVGHGPKAGTAAKPKSAQPNLEPPPATTQEQPVAETTPVPAATTPEVAPAAVPQPEAPQTSKPAPEESKPAPQPEQATVSPEQQPNPGSALSSEQKSDAQPQTAPAPEQKPAEQNSPASADAIPPAPPKAEAQPKITEPPQPEASSADTQPPQPKTNVEEQPQPPPSSDQSAAPLPTQPAAEKPAPQQEAQVPAEKPAEPEAPLPDSPSTVAGLTQPETTPEPEPEPESAPARPKADTRLADTQWKLIQLGGVQIVIEPPNHPMTLAFSPEGRRIAGSAGCHSYIGTFTDDHGKLSLHPGGVVMMGCPDTVIKREQKFVAAMRETDAYRIAGDYLVLSGKGKILAKFKNQLAP